MNSETHCHSQIAVQTHFDRLEIFAYNEGLFNFLEDSLIQMSAPLVPKIGISGGYCTLAVVS